MFFCSYSVVLVVFPWHIPIPISWRRSFGSHIPCYNGYTWLNNSFGQKLCVTWCRHMVEPWYPWLNHCFGRFLVLPPWYHDSCVKTPSGGGDCWRLRRYLDAECRRWCSGMVFLPPMEISCIYIYIYIYMSSYMYISCIYHVYIMYISCIYHVWYCNIRDCWLLGSKHEMMCVV